MAIRALDNKYLETTSPEPQARIQNNLIESYLVVPLAEIAKVVLLCQAKGLPEL